MATGTLYGVCYNSDGEQTDKYQFYAEYRTGTVSVSGNYTPVTVVLKLRRNPAHPYAASAYDLTEGVSVNLTVDGTTLFSSGTANVDTRNAQVWTFTTRSKNVGHNADGTKTVSISASFSGVGANSLKRGTLSGSVKLATIPRASAITSAEAVTLADPVGIKWTPASASFRYKLNFTLGQWSYTTGAIHPNKTSAFTYRGYSIPLEVANQIPNDPEGTMTVKLSTYSDSAATVLVGTMESTFTVTVPDNDLTKPTAVMTLTPVNALPEPFDAMYIVGRTKVKANFTEGQGMYGASIVSVAMCCGGTEYGAPYTSAYLSADGEVTVTGIVTDSRGYRREYPVVITVLPYSKPQIKPVAGENEVIAARCDANGDLSDSGTYLLIKARRSYNPVTIGEVAHNLCRIQYRYKPENAAGYRGWFTILDGDAAGNEVVTAPLLNGNLSEKVTWLVQVQAIDDMGEASCTTILVPTDKVYWHRDGARGSLGFGKYVEENDTFDIAEDKTLKVRGQLALLGQAYQMILDIAHPVGAMLNIASDPGTLIGGVWENTGESLWKRTE